METEKRHRVMYGLAIILQLVVVLVWFPCLWAHLWMGVSVGEVHDRLADRARDFVDHVPENSARRLALWHELCPVHSRCLVDRICRCARPVDVVARDCGVSTNVMLPP